MSQTDKPTLSLDLRGEHCPYNAIATLETLATMQPGERLEVVTDCSQSVHGIPEDTQRQGYKCLAVEQHGALFRFLIEVPLESDEPATTRKPTLGAAFLCQGSVRKNCAAGAAGLPGW